MSYEILEVRRIQSTILKSQYSNLKSYYHA